MRVSDDARLLLLRWDILPDIHLGGELCRRLVVSDVQWIQHMPGWFMHHDGWRGQLSEWSGMHHVVELLHLSCVSMRRPATADLPSLRNVSSRPVHYLAGIAQLSGGCELSADICADAELQRGADVRGSNLRANDPGESDLRGCGILRAESIVQCLWHLSRVRDLRSRRYLRCQHLSEFQHVRRIRYLRGIGDV